MRTVPRARLAAVLRLRSRPDATVWDSTHYMCILKHVSMDTFVVYVAR